MPVLTLGAKSTYSALISGSEVNKYLSRSIARTHIFKSLITLRATTMASAFIAIVGRGLV